MLDASLQAWLLTLCCKNFLSSVAFPFPSGTPGSLLASLACDIRNALSTSTGGQVGSLACFQAGAEQHDAETTHSLWITIDMGNTLNMSAAVAG